MIIALDTSTPTCHLFVYTDTWHEHQWDAGRGLAKGLLGFMQTAITEYGHFPEDVTGIISLQGPGSYTGLRIGITVLNTIASAQAIPIVGVTGEDWLAAGLVRLNAEQDDRLVMPEYGGEPHITTPRK